jgi:predicted ester cyclase
MTTEIQRTAARIPLEVINNGNFELLDELLTTDFVEHSPQPGMPPTREGLKRSLVALKTAFPDIRYTIEDSIDCGDRIVHRLSATGTMTGDFMGITASGMRAAWTEIHIGRTVNGRLTERWAVVDQLGMFVQLGVVPAPGRVPATV